MLRPRGVVVVYGTGAMESQVPLFFFLRNAISLKFIYVYELDAAERAAALAGDRTRPRSGHASSPISERLSRLRDIAAAHEAVEQGKMLGNVVVKIS